MQPSNVSSFSLIQRFYCDNTLVVSVSQHALCPLCMNIFRPAAELVASTGGPIKDPKLSIGVSANGCLSRCGPAMSL